MNQKKLTQAEREQIYLLKLSGQTIPQIALALGTSLACVRKWWRRGRDEGILGLLERKRGRPTRGALSEFSPQVQQTCLKLKREHKRWGANRVLIELRNDPALSGLILPSRSRLYAFFHQECPECLSIWTQHKEVLPTPTATHLGITIIRETFPHAVQRFLKRVVIYLGTLTVALVTVFGFVLVLGTWAQITPALGIPVGLPYAAIPVSFLLMTVYGIVHVIRDIKGFPPLAWDNKG